MKKLEQTAEIIAATPSVNLDMLEFKPGNKADLEIIMTINNVVFPASIIAFYKSCFSFEAEWFSVEVDNYSNPEYHGYINILHPENMLEGNEKKGWSTFFSEPDADPEMQYFHPFDLFHSDENECVGFLIKENKISDQLFFHSLGSGLINAKINVEQYIDLCRKYFFIHGSQNAMFTGDDSKLARIESIIKKLELSGKE